MQTQAEFVAERMKRHLEECKGLEDDPLYKLAHPAPTVISQREYDAYCYAPDFMTKRQAG